MDLLEYFANRVAYQFLILAFLSPVLLLAVLFRKVEALFVPLTLVVVIGWLLVGSWIAGIAASRHVFGGEGFWEGFTNARRDVTHSMWLYMALLPIVGRLFEGEPRDKAPADRPHPRGR